MSWPAMRRVGPFLAPAGHAPVHQPGVASQAVVGPETEPFGHARAEPFDQRVGLLDQAQHGVAALAGA